MNELYVRACIRISSREISCRDELVIFAVSRLGDMVFLSSSLTCYGDNRYGKYEKPEIYDSSDILRLETDIQNHF